MHGWHNLKRLRPRRGWKAAGSIRVDGNEAPELQNVALHCRFLSQNISAAAAEPEVNFSPPKWGRGGSQALPRGVMMDSASENSWPKGGLVEPLRKLVSGMAKPAGIWPAAPRPSA